MSVAVTVVFTGLCALVTGGERVPGEVLLVDLKGIGKVGGVELPAHAPTLVVSLGSLTNAETSGPDRVLTAWPAGAFAEPDEVAADQIGVWDLTGADVRVRVEGAGRTGVDLSPQSWRASSWPEPPSNVNDPEAWRDLRFVADMRALTADGRIDPGLVETSDTDGSALPPAVAARFHLDGGRLDAAIPSHQAHRDDVFEFRAVGGEPRLRQALTDTLRWTLESDASAVVIEIVPVRGGSPKRLVLAKSARPHHLFVSNLPAENVHAHGRSALTDEQFAALHFGAYYELLKTKPAERPLPTLWAARPRTATGAMGPFICPPALFVRD